jgi:2-haloacid dehalogenase
MPNTTLAFDVYGTLVNTNAITHTMEQWLSPEQSVQLARHWRHKQLEYSFRRGLMNAHIPFREVTRQALRYCDQELALQQSPEQLEALMEAYGRLPLHAEARETLEQLKAQGFQSWAFSNGDYKTLAQWMEREALGDLLNGPVSAEALSTFKPDPDLYHHMVSRGGAGIRDTWLVSGNVFDVVGALGAGLRGAWVRRRPEEPFDPWEMQPDVIVEQLSDLPKALERAQSAGGA